MHIWVMKCKEVMTIKLRMMAPDDGHQTVMTEIGHKEETSGQGGKVLFLDLGGIILIIIH